jgi:hypothetical protein
VQAVVTTKATPAEGEKRAMLDQVRAVVPAGLPPRVDWARATPSGYKEEEVAYGGRAARWRGLWS